MHGVMCTRLSQCNSAGTCLFGICSNPVRTGAACDDGNNGTILDTCTSVSVCVGVDPCAGVSCPAADTCHGTGSCVRGSCVIGTTFADGTRCNDGNINTDLDACTDGVCIGRNLCNEVTCTTDACHETTTCSRGRCIPEWHWLSLRAATMATWPRATTFALMGRAVAWICALG